MPSRNQSSPCRETRYSPPPSSSMSHSSHVHADFRSHHPPTSWNGPRIARTVPSTIWERSRTGHRCLTSTSSDHGGRHRRRGRPRAGGSRLALFAGASPTCRKSGGSKRKLSGRWVSKGHTTPALSAPSSAWRRARVSEKRFGFRSAASNSPNCSCGGSDGVAASWRRDDARWGGEILQVGMDHPKQASRCYSSVPGCGTPGGTRCRPRNRSAQRQRLGYPVDALQPDDKLLDETPQHEQERFERLDLVLEVHALLERCTGGEARRRSRWWRPAARSHSSCPSGPSRRVTASTGNAVNAPKVWMPHRCRELPRLSESGSMRRPGDRPESRGHP